MQDEIKDLLKQFGDTIKAIDAANIEREKQEKAIKAAAAATPTKPTSAAAPATAAAPASAAGAAAAAASDDKSAPNSAASSSTSASSLDSKHSASPSASASAAVLPAAAAISTARDAKSEVKREPSEIYRCWKCRFAVFSDVDVVSHAPQQGAFQFAGKKKQEYGALQECGSYFLAGRISTLSPFDGSDGPILCGNPKCGHRLGTYNWAGTQCSCTRASRCAPRFFCGSRARTGSSLVCRLVGLCRRCVGGSSVANHQVQTRCSTESADHSQHSAGNCCVGGRQPQATEGPTAHSRPEANSQCLDQRYRAGSRFIKPCSR
jgi:hypothetical protein